MRLLTVSTLAAVALAAAAPASAALETFSSFSPIGTGNSARNFRWVQSANSKAGGFATSATFYTTSSNTGTAAGARDVRFTSDVLGLSNVTLSFTLSGSVTNTIATLDGANIIQSNTSGTFSFIDTNNTAGFGAGANILSGTFSNSTISGQRNGGVATWNGQGTGVNFNYTSDVFQFANNANYGVAFTLGTISALNATGVGGSAVAVPNKALGSFRAVLGGTFSADPPPTPPPVPEPAIWAQLIIGFSMVGFASRRRKISVAA